MLGRKPLQQGLRQGLSHGPQAFGVPEAGLERDRQIVLELSAVGDVQVRVGDRVPLVEQPEQRLRAYISSYGPTTLAFVFKRD